MNFFWSHLHSQFDSHERYCECGGPLRDIIVNFGNTFEHVPSMEDQHDAAWVHCLTLERNDKSTWMRVEKWWKAFVYFICIMLCSSLSIVRLSLSWYTTLGCTKQKKQWLMRQASIETAGLTSLASENHSERLNSWPQQLLLPYWISMFVWFYLCERSLWTRKADLVLVLGSSLSVPTACDLPEICLEARDGKPETCRQADSKTFIGIRNSKWGVLINRTKSQSQGLFLQILPHLRRFSLIVHWFVSSGHRFISWSWRMAASWSLWICKEHQKMQWRPWEFLLHVMMWWPPDSRNVHDISTWISNRMLDLFY